jgi:hypothetical protein
MKLLAQFNLILGLVLGAGLAIAAAVSHRFLQDNAREEVLRQARLMMELHHKTGQTAPVTQQEHQRSFLPHPSRPSARICCRFSSFKTLLTRRRVSPRRRQCPAVSVGRF